MLEKFLWKGYLLYLSFFEKLMIPSPILEYFVERLNIPNTEGFSISKYKYISCLKLVK